MSKAQSLTAEALAGFAAASSGIEAGACPYDGSSSSGMAWLVGAWLCRAGQPAPRQVAPSRGCSIRADGDLFDLSDPAAIVPLGRTE